MGEKGGTRITQVLTFGIPVADQQRALEFYVGQFGFEVRRDMPMGGGNRWIEVAPPGGATTIALVPAGMPMGIRLGTDDAEADHKDLQASGVDVDPEVMRMGGGVPPMFGFRDPDGNAMVVVGGE